jgi:orotate phosphoribosyltransferase
MENGEPYLGDMGLNLTIDTDIEAIAATCPWGISSGVRAANDNNLGFMYVRGAPKDHGLKQQIEGIPSRYLKVLLIDLNRGKSYLDDAIAALKEKGVYVLLSVSADLSERIKPISISGKNCLVIEDLVSTGGSSASEVQAARNAGGVVNNIISIFNYGFPEAAKMFTGELPYDKKGSKLSAPCEVDSCLWYPTLLEVAKQDGMLNDEQVALLAEWREDAFNWGAKHGFPPVEKKK